jgi:hypothetical protein
MQTKNLASSARGGSANRDHTLVIARQAIPSVVSESSKEPYFGAAKAMSDATIILDFTNAASFSLQQ